MGRESAGADAPKEELLPPQEPIRPEYQKYVAIVLSCLINLCTGSLNAFGTFSVYYASFYYKCDKNSPFVNNCFFIIFPVTCVLEGIAFGFAVHIYHALTLKPTLMISGVLFCGAFIAMYFITDPLIFVIVYGIGVGFGAGGSGYVCTLECWKHFARGKGAVMGIMAACYGFSPTIFGLLFAFLCNPDNLKPIIKVESGETTYYLFEDAVADKVPWVSLTIGLIFVCCYTVVILLFPKIKEEQPMSLSESIASYTSAMKKPIVADCPNLATAMRSWAFWSLTINMFCGITYGVFIVNAYKNYGMTYYKDDQLLSTIGSSAAFISSFGRIIFSILMDIISFKAVYGFNIISQLAVSASITYIIPVSIYLYWVWIAISFFVFAGVFPAFIMESSAVFGNKTGAAAMSLIGQSFTVSSLATILISEVVGKNAGYSWCFHILAMMSVVSVVLTLTSPKSYS